MATKLAGIVILAAAAMAPEPKRKCHDVLGAAGHASPMVYVHVRAALWASRLPMPVLVPASFPRSDGGHGERIT
jgi:hypothetical protein